VPEEQLPATRRHVKGTAPARDTGFVEGHRQKIFMGLSIAGTLLLGPFAINNFFQDRVVLGFVTSAFVLCLLVNAFAIARGRARWRTR